MVQANGQETSDDAAILAYLVNGDPSKEYLPEHNRSRRGMGAVSLDAIDTDGLADSEKRLLAQLLKGITAGGETTDTPQVAEAIGRPADEELQPEATEEAEPIIPDDRLLSKGLHIFTDERRLVLLALLGVNDEGTNGLEFFQRYRHLSGGTDIARRHLDDWILGHELATVTNQNGAGIRDFELTAEGESLLPLAGHLLNWALVNDESLRRLLGFSVHIVPQDESEYELSARLNYEQLRIIYENRRDKIRGTDLMPAGRDKREKTRRLLGRLDKDGWIEIVPGKEQPKEKYPSFIPLVSLDVCKGKPETPREALEDYIAREQALEAGPMTLHGLFYRRKYATASKRAGGADSFVRKVIQEFAAMCTAGQLERLTPGSHPNFWFVLNPAKASRLRDLTDLVEGAKRMSETYVRDGLGYLAKWLLSPDERLIRRLQNDRPNESD